MNADQYYMWSLSQGARRRLSRPAQLAVVNTDEKAAKRIHPDMVAKEEGERETRLDRILRPYGGTFARGGEEPRSYDPEVV